MYKVVVVCLVNSFEQFVSVVYVFDTFVLLLNRCRHIIKLFEDAFKVSVSEQDCDCGSALLDVEFNKVRLIKTEQQFLNRKLWFKGI